MQLQQSSKGHYLDYYSEWVEALRKAKHYYDLKQVAITGQRFLDMIKERLDAGLMTAEMAKNYSIEINKHTELKAATFLN